MRVALIDPSLFTLPYDGRLMQALQCAGAEVELHGRALTPQDGVSAVPIEPTFYRMAGGRLARRLPRAARLAVKGADHLASMRRLRRVLRVARPDVIHFQWLPLPALDARLLPAFRRLAPVVLTVHDTDPFNGSPTARLQRLGFVQSLRACDRLIVHTAQGAARLVALGLPSARITQLPHGPLGTQQADAAADAMQGELGFVLFGKIKPYKGADLLIEAFAALPAALRHQARLRIVGQAYMDTGALLRQAEALGVRDRLSLETRFVDDTEIPAIFAPGTVAVFPYREIEASGVLSLALANGRPVFASRLGSFAETITDGVQGRLLPPGDVPALTQAMQAAIQDRALAASYAGAARALVQALPGWDEIAWRTLAVYREARAASAAGASAPSLPTSSPPSLPPSSPPSRARELA